MEYSCDDWAVPIDEALAMKRAAKNSRLEEEELGLIESDRKGACVGEDAEEDPPCEHLYQYTGPPANVWICAKCGDIQKAP